MIREHHENEDFLVTGGEFGVYVTLDRGANWHRIGGQIPTVPVDDLAIHPRENDLILGTHGRSIWIADDIAPLTTLDASVFEKDLHLFPVRDAVAWRIYTHKGNTGHKFFIAPNPPEGALLHIYAAAAGEAEITVSAAGGDAVRTLKAELEPGLNRVNWDLRYDSPGPGRRPGLRRTAAGSAGASRRLLGAGGEGRRGGGGIRRGVGGPPDPDSRGRPARQP